MKALTALALALLCAAAQAYDDDDDDQIDFRNQYNSPRLYAPDGTYLGNVNNNRFDPNSINNPYGRYGNPMSPDSINNRFGNYGNPYSRQYSYPAPRRLGQ